jgi:hypothetical protein
MEIQYSLYRHFLPGVDKLPLETSLRSLCPLYNAIAITRYIMLLLSALAIDELRIDDGLTINDRLEGDDGLEVDDELRVGDELRIDDELGIRSNNISSSILYDDIAIHIFHNMIFLIRIKRCKPVHSP